MQVDNDLNRVSTSVCGYQSSVRTHIDSNFRVTTSTTRPLDDGGDNLLEVFGQHQPVDFLDNGIGRTDEERALETVD
jgi:hypothetical protein